MTCSPEQPSKEIARMKDTAGLGRQQVFSGANGCCFREHFSVRP